MGSAVIRAFSMLGVTPAIPAKTHNTTSLEPFANACEWLRVGTHESTPVTKFATIRNHSQSQQTAPECTSSQDSQLLQDSFKQASCSTCTHRTQKKTCGKPVQAGLSPHFQIVWHPNDGKGCQAWKPKVDTRDAPGLLEVIRRMAEFYSYTPDKLAYALHDARQYPDHWRQLIRNDRHSSKFLSPPHEKF